MQRRVRAIVLALLLTLIPSFFLLYLAASSRIERDAIAGTRRDVEAVTASLTDQLSRALETLDLDESADRVAVSMSRGVTCPVSVCTEAA